MEIDLNGNGGSRSSIPLEEPFVHETLLIQHWTAEHRTSSQSRERSFVDNRTSILNGNVASGPLDFIRTKVFVRFLLGFRSPLALCNPKVVPPTGRLHDRIGKTFCRIPQDALHDAAALHARRGGFDADTDAPQLLIGALLSGRQLSTGRLLLRLAGLRHHRLVSPGTAILVPDGPRRIGDVLVAGDALVRGPADVGYPSTPASPQTEVHHLLPSTPLSGQE